MAPKRNRSAVGDNRTDGRSPTKEIFNQSGPSRANPIKNEPRSSHEVVARENNPDAARTNRGISRTNPIKKEPRSSDEVVARENNPDAARTNRETNEILNQSGPSRANTIKNEPRISDQFVAAGSNGGRHGGTSRRRSAGTNPHGHGANDLENERNNAVGMMGHMHSVSVKVLWLRRNPNFSAPWENTEEEEINGIGIILNGRIILTVASSMKYYKQVEIMKYGSSRKYPATVLSFGYEYDIVLLKVSNENFWKGLSSVNFGNVELPALLDCIPHIYGNNSFTSGIVSSVKMVSPEYNQQLQLRVLLSGLETFTTTTIALGSPAFNNDGHCVGMTSQIDLDIIQIIPSTVIMHFMKHYNTNGQYTGCPNFGFKWQMMENRHLRTSRGMTDDQTGVSITKVEPTAPCCSILKPYDIILSFDGVKISNDGSITLRLGERISFSYLVTKKHIGDIVAVEVLRNSEILVFQIKLARLHKLIPEHIIEKRPSYYIIAGFVFVKVSLPYLLSKYGKYYKNDDEKRRINLFDTFSNGMTQSCNQQIVAISKVLPAKVNEGYTNFNNHVVLAINRNPVKNLEHLVEMVEYCEEEYLNFDLDDGKKIVLHTTRAKVATAEILTKNGIPCAMSKDLELKYRR